MKDEPRALLDGQVVVWLARLPEVGDLPLRLESVLNVAERERGGKFRFAEDRARFVLGRGLLRTLVGQHLGESPDRVEIALAARDRPVLAQHREVEFSVAHSGDLVAIALTAGARVGIDVEFMRLDIDPAELAPRVFSEADLEKFRRVSALDQRTAFFAAWTRKEAYLKARGEGIADALPEVDVPMGAEDVMSIRDGRDATVGEKWRLVALPVGSDHAGSLAFEGVEKRVAISWVRRAGDGAVELDPASP